VVPEWWQDRNLLGKWNAGGGFAVFQAILGQFQGLKILALRPQKFFTSLAP
jgi:hypothetical protein